MSIIVQKFGGTLVASEKSRREVINRIIEKANNKHKLVVVVSAMGRNGDPYSTDSLINLIDEEYCKKRELDLLMSCGEIISATIISSILSANGYNNIVLTGAQAGILTDNNFGNANVISVIPQKLLDAIDKNNIVIVTGFQGATKDGDITTLGRGGSDTSALIIGEAIRCEYVEIYTDVEGIMTADPKIVPNAQLIDNMCYSEVYQLAEEGAKVIHPKAVEVAKRSNLKVIIKNTSINCKGTIIGFCNKSDEESSVKERLITAITYKRNRAQITVELDNNEEYLQKLLNIIAENNISIDLINILPEKKVFTIDEKHSMPMERILKEGNYKYKVINNCCKISIIGHKINGLPGVMAKIINALLSVNVSILQSSDSNTTIWCLVKDEDTEKSIYALHNEFY
ncbi:aspartate kinase [Proteiniborus ethanoligenes]|uniref:Aspartokinase n=1 Tax=Proteiniborus ethanoligenes TaxID=415015 RepID=A0A1H3N7U9_9FIRM|nr:aspartate kinase [Proteiniborus ethanoligenes]TAH61033.1 MAG: aspartate kinase [Gottschalkiaceae bacterium]SDY84854.1 aspartate kinase [Proteiniborus ethanoligenes]